MGLIWKGNGYMKFKLWDRVICIYEDGEGQFKNHHGYVYDIIDSYYEIAFDNVILWKGHLGNIFRFNEEFLICED